MGTYHKKNPEEFLTKFFRVLSNLVFSMFDGFVKSPNSALRYTLRCFMVRKVQIITQDLRALNLNFYTLPSKSDFLPVF